jgi:hypothetical protein
MPTPSTVHRELPLEQRSHEDLRTERHALANQIQPLQTRLWLIDDELERRERETPPASPLFPAATSHAPVLEVIS